MVALSRGVLAGFLALLTGVSGAEAQTVSSLPDATLPLNDAQTLLYAVQNGQPRRVHPSGLVPGFAIPTSDLLGGLNSSFTSVSVGRNLLLSGGVLSMPVPDADLLGGVGDALSAITVGSGLLLSGGVLSSTVSGGCGSGTLNTVLKFTSTTACGDSHIVDDGTNIVATLGANGHFNVTIPSATNDGGMRFLTGGGVSGTDGGGNINVLLGSGAASGNGGSFNVTLGDGGATAGTGGSFVLATGGGGGGNSGAMTLTTADSTGANAGSVRFVMGSALTSGNAGNFSVELGTGAGGGTNGQFKLTSLPTADPSIANSVWADNGVLVLSGSTVPAVPAAANPTATISGSAVNGVATTYMRSDAAPALANTAVTPGSYTYSSLTVDAQGRLTAASNGTAPASAANPTATVSGSAVNGSAGTFMRSDAAPALANTAVSAGSYVNANITVDAQGRLTAASTGTTPLSTGTSVSLAGPRQYYVCTSTCTVTPPVPVAGYEFCVLNDDNVATVITLAALGSSSMYENTARTAYGTAGTGTLVSGGAVADKVCIVGRDSTHYLTTTSNGTWTAN